MDFSYISSVIKKGMEFARSGKLSDCFSHAFDMMNVYRNYGKDNELEVQQKMLKRMLKYANKHCKFYHEVGKTLSDPLDITQYPLIDKKVIRESIDDITSDEKNKMIYNLASTSGSTGNPLVFYNGNGLDDFYQYQVWKKHGYEEGDKILAMFGIKIDEDKVNNNIYWQDKPIHKSTYGGYNISSLYLNDENIDVYCDYIINLKPSFIRGFPSFICEISQYIVKNKINVDFVVKGIELTSEASFEWQWEIMRKAFKTSNIFFQYGHTESCVFGYSYDETMKMRIEPLYGFTEIIKENGEHAKEGELGEVVVTSLHNYVMPFIRYRTGDIAEFGGYDRQYLIINKIYGRTQDYIINKNNERLYLAAFVAEHHINALARIEKWQFEQSVKGIIKIRIIKTKDYTKDDEEEIKIFFKKYADIDSTIEYVNDIKRAPRGKSQLLVQHIK